MSIEDILFSGTIPEKRALFEFSIEEEDEVILLKFNLWARYFYPNFFKVGDADFHKKIDSNNLAVYKGNIKSFLNLAFRGASKTTRTKLFIAFCIANDLSKFRKYIKALSYDLVNCKQFVTDIYNLLIGSDVRMMYPEIFKKTDAKREETMGSFTTSTGIKVLADTVGSSQRGSIQEDSRPDVIIFDDFETRETLRSAIKTKMIWDNMEEAKNGLSYNGACIYLGNYISELGNVHRLKEKEDNKHAVLVIPIIRDGVITWPERYKQEDIDFIKKDSDDFEGEYLCRPNASKDVFFDRDTLDAMTVKTPERDIAGFRVYKKYDPSHRYAGGHDVAGGVGLDSSASVFIDFSTVPAQVVGTYDSNTVPPEAFGDEIYNESLHFGNCLVAPENNKYDQAILKAKMLGAKLFRSKTGTTLRSAAGARETYIYGWNTNQLTKSKMFSDLRKAVNDGLLVLNDKKLIQEAKSYTRNDLIDSAPDARLTTRHFDLLTACAIAWQMLNEATVRTEDPIPLIYSQEEVNPAV